MFSLLAKLVRKLTRAERNSLAEKLIDLAKEETPDEQPFDPSGGSSAENIPICHLPQCFTTNSAYSFNARNLMSMAQERKTFCGIYMTDSLGNMKLIVGQVKPYLYQSDYNIDLYMQGYGSSSTQLMCFTITQVPVEWVDEFIGTEPQLA